MNSPADLTKDPILRLNQVSELIGLSKASIRKLKESGELPSIKIGRRAVGWHLSTVQSYLNSLNGGC